MKVADIPLPAMPEDDAALAQLAEDAGYAVTFARKGSGGSNAAQWELTRMADAILRGQSPHLRGRYSLGDKYADRPTFANRPYKTAVLYASGKAGRRSVSPR